MEENTNNTQPNQVNLDEIEEKVNNAGVKVTGFVNDAVISADENVKEGESGFTSIKDRIDEVSVEIDAEKFKQYASEKELPAETKVEDLTAEQRNEMDSIELSDEYLLGKANEVADDLYKDYSEKNDFLNLMIGDKEDESKVGKLNEDLEILNNELDERNNKIAELKEKMENTPQFIEGEEGKQEPNPEYEELENEMSTLNNEVERINNIIHRTEDVKQTCIHAMGLQKKVRENIEKSLVATFGERIGNQVIAAHDKTKKVEGQTQNINEQTQGDDTQTQNNQPQDQTQQQEQQEQNVQQQGAPTQGAAPAAGAAQVQGEEEVVDPKQVEETNKMFEQLGINKDAQLTPELAMGLLKKYSSKDISDEDKLKMFQNPEIKDKIQSAINAANANKKGHPLFALKYRKVRKDLTKLMDNTLPKQVLEQCGIMDIDENALVAMERAKNSIQAQLDGPGLSPEDRKSLEEQMAKLNDVSNFRNGNADVKLMTRRAIDAVKHFTAKNITHRDAFAKQLPPAMEVNEEPVVEEQENSWKNMTKDEEEITKNDVQIEEKEKTMTPEEIEAKKKQQEELNKKNQEQQIGD